MEFTNIPAVSNHLSSKMGSSGQFTLDRIAITIDSDVGESNFESEPQESADLNTLHYEVIMPTDRNQPQVLDVVSLEEGDQVNVNEIHL